jgi:hypothetical protein
VLVFCHGGDTEMLYFSLTTANVRESPTPASVTRWFNLAAANAAENRHFQTSLA